VSVGPTVGAALGDALGLEDGEGDEDAPGVTDGVVAGTVDGARELPPPPHPVATTADRPANTHKTRSGRRTLRSFEH
jgi:hypothetical protein